MVVDRDFLDEVSLQKLTTTGKIEPSTPLQEEHACIDRMKVKACCSLSVVATNRVPQSSNIILRRSVIGHLLIAPVLRQNCDLL